MKSTIEYDRVYHIFNRGNNYENIFVDKGDYQNFMEFYYIYIDSIADTYAYCLLRNHFHVLLRVKNESQIGYFNSDDACSENLAKKWKTYFPEKSGLKFQKKPKPHGQFQHLFASYTKYFNKKHGRAGSLFTKTYKRVMVDSRKYFTNLIVYLHNNPVKHGFTEHAGDYPWSSYQALLSTNKTKLKREDVIKHFHDLENYRYMHRTLAQDDEDGLKGLIVE